MNKYRKILICCVGVAVIIVLTLSYSVIWRKTAKIKAEQQNEQTQVPDLIKQLYNISIPDELNPEAKGFTALKDGQVEVRGPDIVRNGSVDKSGPQDFLRWAAYLNTDSSDYTIADFNNDGLDDVAVVMVETGGGSGFFYYLVIFKNHAGGLKYLTSEYLGDRIKVNKISYTSGVITADIITQGPNEGLCCPSMPATLKFKLEGNHLE